jgi:hypothetical protein
VLENPFSFGGGDRYYSSTTAPDPVNLAAICGKVTGAIADLLREYGPELERRILLSFRQWNNAFRDQLRNVSTECHLCRLEDDWFQRFNTQGRRFLKSKTGKFPVTSFTSIPGLLERAA